MSNSPSVFIVDDDDSIQRWCEDVLREIGLSCQNFSTAQAFLDSAWQQEAQCVLIDAKIQLDERKAPLESNSADAQATNFDMLAKVIRGNGSMPAVILSHDGDGSLVRSAFLFGAHDFLLKPLDSKEFQRVVGSAVARKSRRAIVDESLPVEPEFRRWLDNLTPREFEVLGEMLRGMSIKQLAARFEISIQTAAKHRARVLHKMRVENEVQLIHLLGRRWQQIYSDIVI